MRFRNLRIAWSVLWGVACVLLIALWVRSYSRADYLQSVNSLASVGFASNMGEVGASFWRTPPPIAASLRMLTYDSSTAERHPELLNSMFAFFKYADGWETWCPHWFGCIVLLTFASMPWIHYSNQFSLRTLLIATTLVAVVLGLVAYVVAPPARIRKAGFLLRSPSRYTAGNGNTYGRSKK